MEPIICPICNQQMTRPGWTGNIEKPYIQFCLRCYEEESYCVKIRGEGKTREEAEDDFRKNLSKHLEK